MQSRGLLIGLVVGCLALALCACALVVAGAGFFYVRSVGLLDATATPRPTRDPDATARPAPTPDTATTGEMDVIQDWVIEQRGLEPNGEGVERKFLSPDEVLDRTLQDFEEDTSPEEIADDVRVLAVLGLIEPGFDLYNLYLRLYSEGVAGFYDPDTGELVVVSEVGGLNVYERTTFAHEYNHALQDQNYDVRAMGFSDEGWEEDSEKAAAVQALLEGDSILLEEQYQATLTPAEQREYDRIVNAQDISVYFELPDYLLQDFFFPYSQGLDFVRRYYDEGGWARVDEVWRDPPSSTEHILHPERYEAGDNPIAVPRPVLTDTLGSGWRQIDTNTMGEWYTYLILAYGEDSGARLTESRAARAAEGWGGDSYTASTNDATGQDVLTLRAVWDTAEDAGEFADAFGDYADERFGQAVDEGAGFRCWEGLERHCLYLNDVHTLWLAAPDQAMVAKLLEVFPELAVVSPK
jgi:hypothetical protein